MIYLEDNNKYQSDWYDRHQNKNGYIFQITNEVTGEKYIGSTTNNPKKRLWQLRANAKAGQRGKLYDSMRTHGTDAFSVLTLYTCTEFSDHKQLRKEYIKEFKPELN